MRTYRKNHRKYNRSVVKVNWNWNRSLESMLRIGLMVLAALFIFRNLSWLNSMFLPQIPFGIILLIILGIFMLQHVHRVLKWYSFWLKKGNGFGNIIIHICLHLAICSIILAVGIAQLNSWL
jgi:hypothetical protein